MANETLNLIAQTIYDRKGSNIIAIDVSKISSMTDYIIVAEGNVDRHVSAIVNSVDKSLKEIGERPLHSEGLGQGDWCVLDYGNFVIHVFTPELREKYKLEMLWSEGEIVDLEIDVSPVESHG